MGAGGDVFVLDMGEPVRILDMAPSMIHLSGLEVKDVVMKHRQLRDVLPPTAAGKAGSQNATTAAKVAQLH